MGAWRSQLDEAVDLLESLRPFPLLGDDHAAVQAVVVGQATVGLGGGRRDPGVLPSGDPQRAQVVLASRIALSQTGCEGNGTWILLKW
jgi:hypothetical protein